MNFNAAAFRKFANTPKRPASSPQKNQESPVIKEESKEDQNSETKPTTSTKELEKVERTNITCVPGDRLCKADERTVASSGTYKSEDFIYASIAGRVVISYPSKEVKFIGVEGPNSKRKTGILR